MNKSLDMVKCYRVVKVYLEGNKVRRTRWTQVLIGKRAYSATRSTFTWAYDLAEKENGGVWEGTDPDGRRWMWDINEVYYDGYERGAIDYTTGDYYDMEAYNEKRAKRRVR